MEGVTTVWGGVAETYDGLAPVETYSPDIEVETSAE